MSCSIHKMMTIYSEVLSGNDVSKTVHYGQSTVPTVLQKQIT